MKSRTIIKNEPKRSDGRRPHLSRYIIAGSVRVTFRIYWIEDVRSVSPIPAASMM